MASVTGSHLQFFAPGGLAANVVLTPTGTTTSASGFNIEVFTSTAGSLGSGFQAAAFIQGAQPVSGDIVQAGSLISTEMLLDGTYSVTDQTGGESISIQGAAAGSSNITVIGSFGDTITGSTIVGNQQFIDALSSPNPGAETIIGGTGNTTVSAGNGDSITGSTVSGALALEVAGNAAGGLTVTGGATTLTVFNFGGGSSVAGSSGTTFIDGSYPGGGNSTLDAGSGSLAFVKGAAGDTINGGSASSEILDGHLGNQTVTGGSGFSTKIEGGPGDSLVGGTGTVTQLDGRLGDQTILGSNNGGFGAESIIFGGPNDSVVGKADTLFYDGDGDIGGNNATVTGGAGQLVAFNLGTGDSITGSSAGTTFIDDTYGHGGNDTLVGSVGSSTVLAGAGDSVFAGTGAMDIRLQTSLDNPSTVSGGEHINLSNSTVASVIRDVTVTGGTGTSATVTGWNTSLDTIISKTSVNSSNVFTGGSGSDGSGGTVLTFSDGSTMDIVGVASIASIKFLQ